MIPQTQSLPPVPVTFPGSPTHRVAGVDLAAGWADPDQASTLQMDRRVRLVRVDQCLVGELPPEARNRWWILAVIAGWAYLPSQSN